MSLIYIFRIKGTLDNVTLSHLNWNKINFNFPPNFDNGTEFTPFNLTLYNISLEGHYAAEGNIGDLFGVSGQGPFW